MAHNTTAKNPERTQSFLEKIERYIGKCPGCRVGELCGVIQRARPTVNWYVKLLIEAGKIRRCNRNGHWQYYPVKAQDITAESVTRTDGNRTVHYGTHRSAPIKNPDAMHSSASLSGHRREVNHHA